MARSLGAFISYRRNDEFMRPGEEMPGSFIQKLREALLAAGFSTVFVDIGAGGLEYGDVFDARLYKEIDDCDLFVAVVGTSWLQILKRRRESLEDDILVHEIHTALKGEKEILPILVDGAAMPSEFELPVQIDRFHARQAISIRSGDPVDVIARALTPIFKTVDRAEIAYVYLTVGLVAKYKRLALTILGGAAVAAIVLCAVAVIWFSDVIAPMAEQWQFYVGVSIPIMAILTGLWFMFDPATVRRNDFNREFRRSGRRR